MSGETRHPPELAGPPQEALARWDGDGGALPDGPREGAITSHTHCGIPELSNAELVQLRVRVIALENLVIALIAGASDQDRRAAREMAAHIAPRPGSTPHPLTVQASNRMIDVIERAERVRSR